MQKMDPANPKKWGSNQQVRNHSFSTAILFSKVQHDPIADCFNWKENEPYSAEMHIPGSICYHHIEARLISRM